MSIVAVGFYVLSAVLLSLALGAVSIGVILALWWETPVLWWGGYAFLCGKRTRAHTWAVALIGLPLVCTLVLLHIALFTSTSSTTALGYFFVPFYLLIAVMVASGITGRVVGWVNRRKPDVRATAVHS